MEDDVYFTKEIKNLDVYMSSLPSDWDMLYIGGNHIYGQPPQKINEKIFYKNSVENITGSFFILLLLTP